MRTVDPGTTEIPQLTTQDWATYGSVAALVRVVSEQARPAITAGDGVEVPQEWGRDVGVRVVSVLWEHPEAVTDVEVEDQLTLYTWPGWIEEDGQRVESVVRGQARMDVGQNYVVLLADTEIDNTPSLMLLETREPSDLPAEQVSTVLSDVVLAPEAAPRAGETFSARVARIQAERP